VLTRGRAAHGPAIQRLADTFTWERVAQPLIRFAELGRPSERRRGDLARRRPLQLGRGLAYRAGRNSLNAVGLKDWPTLY